MTEHNPAPTQATLMPLAELEDALVETEDEYCLAAMHENALCTVFEAAYFVRDNYEQICTTPHAEAAPVQNTPATSYAADSSGTNASMGLHAAPDDDQDGGVLLQTDLIVVRSALVMCAKSRTLAGQKAAKALAILNRMIAGKAEGV